MTLFASCDDCLECGGEGKRPDGGFCGCLHECRIDGKGRITTVANPSKEKPTRNHALWVEWKKGRKLKAIAAEFGISASLVSDQAHKIENRLRRALDEYEKPIDYDHCYGVQFDFIRTSSGELEYAMTPAETVATGMKKTWNWFPQPRPKLKPKPEPTPLPCGQGILRIDRKLLGTVDIRALLPPMHRTVRESDCGDHVEWLLEGPLMPRQTPPAYVHMVVQPHEPWLPFCTAWWRHDPTATWPVPREAFRGN